MHKTRLRCFTAKSVGRCRETLRAAIIFGAGPKFDRAFLKKGDVFTDELIDSYLEIKRAELKEYDKTPHPIEFKMYYSL